MLIDVLVTRPAPFWLPAMAERDPDTGEKIRPICSKLLLAPGANRVPKERWLQAMQHPTVRIHVEVGTLKVDASAREVAEHTHAPDPMSGLEELTVDKARPWIEASESLDLLSRWRTGETKGKRRVGILELIDARTAELTSDDDEES